MQLYDLYKKALNFDFLTKEDAIFLYQNASLSELIFVANELRKQQQKPADRNKVGWIIDRNINITNGCIAQCKFCNFYRSPASKEVYVTSTAEYRQKIKELFSLGGNQLLLQGGLHPGLKLDWYKNLFSSLKNEFPNLKLHALGPAEIHHIAKISGTDYKQTLEELINAGLDSLPGAGAEILSDRVRKQISRYKCSAAQWLDVMREAHIQGITTSATMMFGHIESLEERIEHLVKIRELQSEKPTYSEGFTTFVLWPFQDKGTELNLKSGVVNLISGAEYVRMVAISRIMLPNIKNLQASWLTVGKETAQLCLNAGANDFGSVMIEENVVSAAGSNHKFDAEGIQQAIREAGFIPAKRNQKYEYVEA